MQNLCHHGLRTTLVFVALFSGCLARDGNVETDPGGGTETPPDSHVLPNTPTCVSATADVGQGHPLSIVRFETSDIVEEPWVRVVAENAGHYTLTNASPVDGTLFEIVVPVHPSGISGGRVSLQLTNGVDVCPAVEFDVLPMEPAPGAAQQLFDRAGEFHSSVLADLGLSESDAHAAVVSGAETIEIRTEEADHVIPILMAWLWNHPENPTSAVRAMEMATPDGLELVDAIVAHHKLVEDAPEPVPTASASALVNGLFQVDDEQSLHDALEWGRGNCNRERNEELRKIFGSASLLSAAMYDPILVGVGVGFTTTGLTLGTYAAAVCATRPDKLTGVSASPSPFQFNEDRDGPQPFEDITVTAVSGPAFFIPKAVFQFAFAGLGAAQWAELGKLASSAPHGLVQEFVTSVLSKGLEIAGAASGLEVGPYEWNVKFRDLRWFDIIAQQNKVSVSQCAPFPCLEAQHIGPYESVKIAPKLELFPGSAVFTEVPSPVNAIKVELGRTERLADPGTTAAIDYSVTYADDPVLAWESDVTLMGLDGDGKTHSEAGSVRLTLPISESAYPISVRAKSDANTGLRAIPGRPERADFTIFVLGDIIAGPDGRCVYPGQPLPLWVEVREVEGETYEILWGSPYVTESPNVEGEAEFKAPDVEDTYPVDVVARYSSGVEVRDTINVRVGDCRCWYDIDLRGPDTFQRSGEFGMTVRTSFLNLEMTDLLKTIELNFPETGPADAAILYERTAGETPLDGWFPGGMFVTVGGNRLAGGSDSLVHLWTTPTGHYMAEWVGVVTNPMTELRSVGRITVHGVGEHEDAGVKCLKEDFYQAPETP